MVDLKTFNTFKDKYEYELKHHSKAAIYLAFNHYISGRLDLVDAIIRREYNRQQRRQADKQYRRWMKSIKRKNSK